MYICGIVYYSFALKRSASGVNAHARSVCSIVACVFACGRCDGHQMREVQCADTCVKQFVCCGVVLARHKNWVAGLIHFPCPSCLGRPFYCFALVWARSFARILCRRLGSYNSVYSSQKVRIFQIIIIVKFRKSNSTSKCTVWLTVLFLRHSNALRLDTLQIIRDADIVQISLCLQHICRSLVRFTTAFAAHTFSD